MATLVAARRRDRPLDGAQQRLVDEALARAERASVELASSPTGPSPPSPTLPSRMPLPGDVAVSVNRLPGPVEAAAYFVVAKDGTLQLQVRDDGIGGARPRAAASPGWPTARPSSTVSCGSTARRTAAR